MKMYGAVYTGRDSSAWLDRRRWDQVHKIPHMGKLMHLIPIDDEIIHFIKVIKTVSTLL